MTTQLSIQSPADLVHKISGSAGTANFNGGSPDGDLSTGPGRFEWATGTNQGLVAPSLLGINDPMRVLRLQLSMAGHTTWKVELADNGSLVTLASGTTEVLYNIEGLTTLMPGQMLKVTTTGAGTTSVKMICTLASAYMYSPSPRAV